MNPPPRSKILLALGTVYIVWGSTYLGIRFMVAELPPLLSGGFRYLIAGGVFYVAARLRPGAAPPATGRQLRNAVLLGVGLVGLSNGLVNMAERHVPSGLTALLLAVMPLWVALIEMLRPRGQRPTARALLGVATGFVGTALLVWHPPGGQPLHIVSALLLGLASLNWALCSVAGRHADRPANWMISSGVEMMAGGVAQLIVGSATGEIGALAAAHPGPHALWAFVYLVVIGSWLGYGAFSWLIRNAPPTFVATYAYVNPLVAVILGAAIAGEALGLRTLAGGAVIVLSVVVVTTARRPVRSGSDAANDRSRHG